MRVKDDSMQRTEQRGLWGERMALKQLLGSGATVGKGWSLRILPAGTLE